MVCIYNPTPEQLNALDKYASVLGSEEAAYYVLSQNNGYTLDKTPYGEDSDLYNDLKAQLGDEDMAIRTKSMLYTSNFLNANGDWTMGTMNDPTMFDAKGEPVIGAITSAVSTELADIMNNQFLADPMFPSVEIDDLSRVSPTDSLSDYAVEQLLETSFTQYVDEKQAEYLRANKTATDVEKRQNKIQLSRQWYSRKVNAIMTEQVKSLATAFGFTYIQHPNGTIELRTKGRDSLTGVRRLRMQFLNNLVNDPLHEELETQILGKVRLGESATLQVEGAKDYMHDALVRHIQNDEMLAANTLIKIGLTDGTATTVNKSLAYHYITMFLDSPLIDAGLKAVDDGKGRSKLYLVNKLIDTITSPTVVGAKNTSIVEKVYYEGIDQKMFDDFWDNFDDLVNEVINKGVKSEQARAKILSVVAAAFQTNDTYNIYTRTPLYSPTAAYDYFADWYSTKYKPWGPQNDKQLNEIQAFLQTLDVYYQNKIARQERDEHVSKESKVRTQNALSKLEHYDQNNPVDIEKAIEDILDVAYEEIRDAQQVLDDINTSGKNILEIVAKLGSEYGNVVAFYNYIINVQMAPFFPTNGGMFTSKRQMYITIKDLLSNLNNSYRIELSRATNAYVDYYIDTHVSKYAATEEQIRNAKANAHLELINSATYGDLKNYELWVMMNSVSKSSIVRQVSDSIMRLNVNRDQVVRKAAMQLQQQIVAAKKAMAKRPISWGGYVFSPRNFQALFQERYSDGTPSGMFVRRLHYGNLFKARKDFNIKIVGEIERDIQNKTGNLHYRLETDDYGNPIFPEGPEWDVYWRKYEHAINAFECEHGHKRFLQEYYDIRIDSLSRDTLAIQEDIQNRIDIILRSVTREVVDTSGHVHKIPHLEDLMLEERRQLDELYREQDNLGNEYTIQGEHKQGTVLRMAQEVKAFRNAIKDRILYATDQEKYDAALNSVDPAKQADFIKFNTERDINPKFWEIYKVLDKEYRDQMPSFLDSAFEECSRIVKEINDIANTVKHLRYSQPNLRALGDSAWVRLKELDEELEVAYQPIAQYKQSLGDAAPLSAFAQIGRLFEVYDVNDQNKTAIDAFMDDARNEDLLESASLGYPVHDHENDAYDKYYVYKTIQGVPTRVPLSIFSYMGPGVFSDGIKQRFGVVDPFEYIKDLPKRFYNKILDPNDQDAHYADPDKALMDPEFDPDEGTYLQPKEINPAYEVLSDPKQTPPEVFELYKLCMEIKAAADSFIPYLSAQNQYKLPQMRASDLAILSRIFSRGVFKTFGRIFTNNFIANETDEDILDDFTTLPDGTRVNSVPVKFIDALPDMTTLTTDVAGSIIAYYHMAANYYFKQEVAPIYQALLQQVGEDQYIESPNGQQHLILGKTTNQYAKMKNVIDSQLYDQKQIWGERGSQRITGTQKTVFKAAKFFAKIGTLAALARNIFSQTTGFFDASNKLQSFAFAGEAFNQKDVAFGISLFNAYLVSGRLFNEIGEPLPHNLIAAMMQKNNLGGEIIYKYSGGYKSKFRRFVGLERSGMGGFRISDYSINAVLSLAIYNNYRLLDNEFLSEVEFKNKLRRQGLSNKEINKRYDKATTLLNAYNYNGGLLGVIQKGRGEFVMKDQYKQMLGESGVRKLEQNIQKALHTWAPKLNGAVSDADKAVIQQNILAGFTVALRSYLINELQTRFVNGQDFQDPKVSKKQLNILKQRRNALKKIYKQTYSDSKKRTELDKLTAKRSELETELLKLNISGDIKAFNYDMLKAIGGLAVAEGSIGWLMGSTFGTVGGVVGSIAAGVHGGWSAYSNLKSRGSSNVNAFISKIDKLNAEIAVIDEKIRALNLSDAKDLLHMEIININQEIAEMANKLNDNAGFYDYARNIVTNGTNRLAGRALTNAMRIVINQVNQILPEKIRSLNATYRPNITPLQIRGLKRSCMDVVLLGALWLQTTYFLSWYRYDDSRAFLGGYAREYVDPVMKKSDELIGEAMSPIMQSDLWKSTWEIVRNSATEGIVHDISDTAPILFSGIDKAIEAKADAMLGFDKKVSRKTGNVTRVKRDPVQRQIQFLKSAAALQSLKTFTEQIAPYDPQTINDLAGVVSANFNVISKQLEAEQQILKDGQVGKLDDFMQSGPYHAYFDRFEYGNAHGLQRPFGYPSSYEQTTESGVVARINFLSGAGLNKYLIPQKEKTQKAKKQKKSKKKNKPLGRKPPKRLI